MTDRATVLYKERLIKCASIFSQELERLHGVTYRVQPIFDAGLECQRGTIPAIPAGYKADNPVLPDLKPTNFKSPTTGQEITIKDWRDVIFAHCIRNTQRSAVVREPGPREHPKMYTSTAIPGQKIFPVPVIEFLGAPIKKCITSKGAGMDLLDHGISISIPQQRLGGSVDSVDLLINPCLSGPFILPDGYELASPVYVIEPSQQGVLQKPCTVRIQHYISLQNERDCDGMTFISAKIAPQTRWFGPYDFKEVKGYKQTFTPNSQVGEIELHHFCCLACARRFGKHLDLDFHVLHILYLHTGRGSTLYSARLYRDCPSPGLEQLGAFCMCLDHPAYTRVSITMTTKSV